MKMVSGDAEMGSNDRRPLEPPVVNGSESSLQEAQGNFELGKSLHKKRKKKKKGASDDGTHLEPPGNSSSVLGMTESQSIAELQSLSKKRKKKKKGASDDDAHLEPPGNNNSVFGRTESQSIAELQSLSKKRKKKKIGASDDGTHLDPPGNNISDLGNTESQSIVELQSSSKKRKKKKERASKDSACAEPAEKNDSELGLREAQNSMEMKSSTKKRKKRERGTSNGGTCLGAPENNSPDLGMTVPQSIVGLQPSTKKRKNRKTGASHDSECVEPAENNDSELGLIEAQNNMGMKSSTDKRKKKKRGGKKRKRGGSGDSMCLESAVNNSPESGLIEARGNVDLGNLQGNLQEEISTLNDSSTDVNLCLGSEADVGRGTVLLTTQTLPKSTKRTKKRKNHEKRKHIHNAVVAELYSVRNGENTLIAEKQIVSQWSDFPDSVQNTSKHVNVAKQTLKESKKDNILQMSLERPRVGHANKKLLILDINGLLADIVLNPPRGYRPDIVVSRKSVFKRPFCDDFLRFCFEKFNVAVWSSRTKKNVTVVIDFLMGDSKKKLLFCWDQSHCTRTGVRTIENRNKPLVLKELRKLWENANSKLPWKNGDYDESNTLLLDDSPYKALRNPAHTALFPRSYQFTDIGDNSLGPGGDIRTYLEHVADAPNVQEFVRRNPFGQEAISESNPNWGFYSEIIGVDKCKLSTCHR